MNAFICDKHGEFESNAKMRAFCPECGANVRRKYDSTGTPDAGPTGGETPPTAAETPTETENQQPNNGRNVTSEESVRTITPDENRGRKIRVTRKVRVKARPKEPIKLNIKHKKVGKKVRPEIKERVQTNKEKADKHLQKEGTVWNWVQKTGF
jgi:hypothetical protein